MWMICDSKVQTWCWYIITPHCQSEVVRQWSSSYMNFSLVPLFLCHLQFTSVRHSVKRAHKFPILFYDFIVSLPKDKKYYWCNLFVNLWQNMAAGIVVVWPGFWRSRPPSIVSVTAGMECWLCFVFLFDKKWLKATGSALGIVHTERLWMRKRHKKQMGY